MSAPVVLWRAWELLLARVRRGCGVTGAEQLWEERESQPNPTQPNPIFCGDFHGNFTPNPEFFFGGEVGISTGDSHPHSMPLLVFLISSSAWQVKTSPRSHSTSVTTTRLPVT